MRALVTIAHRGSKNRPFLLQVLDAFPRMDHDVDAVALCETSHSHRSVTRQELVGEAGPRAAVMGKAVRAVTRRRTQAATPARVRRG